MTSSIKRSDGLQITIPVFSCVCFCSRAQIPFLQVALHHQRLFSALPPAYQSCCSSLCFLPLPLSWRPLILFFLSFLEDHRHFYQRPLVRQAIFLFSL